MPAPLLGIPNDPRGTDVQDFHGQTYQLAIPMKDASFASFAQAEQIARDKTWHPLQVDSSEVLFQIPPDPMEGVKSYSGSWTGAAGLDLDVFRPKAWRDCMSWAGAPMWTAKSAESCSGPSR